MTVLRSDHRWRGGDAEENCGGTITDGRDRADTCAMLKGIGFTADALARPMSSAANTWIETLLIVLYQSSRS